MLLPGEVSLLFNGEKSADAIVAISNEPRIETVEDSQDSEGLNVRFACNSIRKLSAWRNLALS